jgi:hypothetical protein
MTKKKENPARPGRKGRGESTEQVTIKGGKSLIQRYLKRKTELEIKTHSKMLEHLLNAEGKH